MKYLLLKKYKKLQQLYGGNSSRKYQPGHQQLKQGNILKQTVEKILKE